MFSQHNKIVCQIAQPWMVLIWIVLLDFGITLVVSNTAFGQFGPGGLPPVIEPSQRSGDQPEVERPRPPKPLQPPSQILPPPPSPTQPERDKLPTIKVFIKEIRVVGNTVFSQEELAKVTSPYVSRDVTTEDLEELRRALTLLYVNKGFVNSGAVLPDQTVQDGVVTIQIIEGELSDIEIEGTKNFLPFYIRKRVELSAGPPLNIRPLRSRLQLLLQDPRFQRLNAELKPGLRPGEGVLHLKVEEASPYKAWVEFNNFQSPTVGAERGLGTVEHQNLLGLGDTMRFQYARSVGTDPLVDVNYTLPITIWDTTLTTRYRRAKFEVIEEPFKSLDIRLDTQIVGFTLLQPIYRTTNQQFNLSLVAEQLSTHLSFLGGQPFTFNAGTSSTGFQIVSALRFVQDWVDRRPKQVTSVRSQFSVGLDALDATINPSPLPDSQFFKWLGQAQWARRFDPWRVQVLSRMDLQISNDALFPLEQFALGGRFTVRGYRENTNISDNAFFYSFETRIPIIRSALGEDILQLAPFVDVGHSWNTNPRPNRDNPNEQTLASVGVGMRWSILQRAQFQVYWGQRLVHVPNPHDNLQDYGVHVQFVVQAL